MQKPSVGRVVLYFSKDKESAEKGQPRPALITHVFGDSMVNVAVLPDGSFDKKHVVKCPTSISLFEAQTDEQRTAGPDQWCEWPAYVGPAKSAPATGGVDMNARLDHLCDAVRAIANNEGGSIAGRVNGIIERGLAATLATTPPSAPTEKAPA